MKYLKIFTDFAIDIEPLNDAEVGRLFRAMLLYAEAGTATQLKGNERFIWATAKKSIDDQNKKHQQRCEINKRIATNRYESLRTATNEHETHQEIKAEIEKDKERSKEKEKDKEENKEKE